MPSSRGLHGQSNGLEDDSNILVLQNAGDVNHSFRHRRRIRIYIIIKVHYYLLI